MSGRDVEAAAPEAVAAGDEAASAGIGAVTAAGPDVAGTAAAPRRRAAVTPGVRLHDLPAGTVEERIRMAAARGFSCIQLPSKVLYTSYGIDRSGLTPALAQHLRCELDASGVQVAVLGCYKNLAVPDAAQLAENLAEYEACLAFAAELGGCPVGTETGRPNAGNAIGDDRLTDAALDRFCSGLAQALAYAERAGVRLLIEPGWNEVVCTLERCRQVLDRMDSPALGVIYDAVSLLHPRVAAPTAAQAEVARMLKLCGERIEVLHAKDFEVVDNEDAAGWCDGSGSRLVCHGVGATGAFDYRPVLTWAARTRPGIPAIVENGNEQTFAISRELLESVPA